MTGDTILLVDADPGIEEKIVSTLESEGYIVFASEGSKVNAEMADKFRPALIFLRPLSPSAAGFAVCRTIHTLETLRDVPVVILASLKGPIDPRFTDYYGIVDFLKLSFTPEELIEKTAAIIGRVQSKESSPVIEEIAPGEHDDRTEQEVSHVGDAPGHEEDAAQAPPAEDVKGSERFEEAWHAEGQEKVTGNDRVVRAEKKYTAQQYERKWSKRKRTNKKGPVVIVVAVIAIIVAGFVLYFDYMLPENPVREVRPKPAPQKEQDITGNTPDAPSSLPPPPVQTTESAALLDGKTFYAAQIGAFKTEGGAEALAQKFRLKGHEAYVQRGTAKDSSDVYRVLIGRFEKRKEAVTLAATVGAEEKIKTTIFQEK